MTSTTPSSEPEATTPPTDADSVGGVVLADLKLHGSLKKSLIEVKWTIPLLYKIVDMHGWQGIVDIMDWKDDSRVTKISDALVAAGLPPLPDDGVRREAREAKAKRQALCRTCGKREKAKGKQKCRWCWLLAQPIEDQIRAAELRLEMAPEPHRSRVSPDEWPEGERWCAGCQSFIPTFYATGSRCKACASKAAHATRLKAVYGITREEYEALEAFQDGRCWVCHRKARSKRLAVDHNHKTGEVRGLLCSDNERGCNAVLIALIEMHGGLDVARRIVDYFEEPPARRFFGEMKGRLEPPKGATVNEQGVDIFDPFAEGS